MRKPVSVNSGNISSDGCQFVVLAGRTSGSICVGSFWRSERERQVPKDFYRAIASRVMASYGFVCLCIRTPCWTRAHMSPSLYDRIKNNFVSLASSRRKKLVFAMIDDESASSSQAKDILVMESSLTFLLQRQRNS